MKVKNKVSTLREINPDVPKLRDTNSTKCQSPKANSLLHQTKINDFKKIRLIGRGKFGDVYLVKYGFDDLDTKKRVLSQLWKSSGRSICSAALNSKTKNLLNSSSGR